MTGPGAERRARSAGAALTIGQLAAHVGVTIRAIRHYHHRGLLAEPARDLSGYRRYGAQAVIDLIRIKTLSDAGVPLDRVRHLLDADRSEFAAAIADIDKMLRDRIKGLEQLRRRLPELRAGDRLVLPVEVTELLDQMRSLGVSERSMTLERDGWILLMARLPDQVPRWAADKSAALADADFARLYLDFDRAYDWDPDDPRLIELAANVAAWMAKQPPSSPPQSDTAISTINTLLSAEVATESPAWDRLGELSRAQLAPSHKAARPVRQPRGGRPDPTSQRPRSVPRRSPSPSLDTDPGHPSSIGDRNSSLVGVAARPAGRMHGVEARRVVYADHLLDALKSAPPSTADDVTIDGDGQRIDTPEKARALVARENACRAAEARAGHDAERG
ncbi:MAG: MerR family transcriptional regulator [Acidimicrobiales bacterium]